MQSINIKKGAYPLILERSQLMNHSVVESVLPPLIAASLMVGIIKRDMTARWGWMDMGGTAQRTAGGEGGSSKNESGFSDGRLVKVITTGAAW
jgi:hypothetical protein